MKSELIENKGYNLSIHEYNGYKIFRGRSCYPFHIEKDGIIFYYKLKMSLNKIIKLIDENKIFDYYTFCHSGRKEDEKNYKSYEEYKKHCEEIYKKGMEKFI